MTMDKLFGVAENALKLTEDRASLITTNLVNSSTPRFKAKDIDFYDVLKKMGGSDTGLDSTNSHHLTGMNGNISQSEIKYRIPMQTSMDGNTVDPEIERKNFMQNSIRYQVSLTFIQNKTDELIKAIKGDQA